MSAQPEENQRVANFENTQTHSVQKIRQMAEVELLSPQQLEEKNILNPATPNKGMLNVFREMRTTLIQSSSKRNFVAMISSVIHGGGATFVATNLAAAFALDKSKTALLIDCNLYEPSLHTIFDLTPEYGLTDYLDDPTLSIDDIIYASGVQRLRVVPAGSNREAGAEYFSSERMARFIEAVKARYPDRFIFIDAPPVGLSAEGRIVAELSDFSLLVAPYGKVTEAQIESSIEAVGKPDSTCVIFNN